MIQPFKCGAAMEETRDSFLDKLRRRDQAAWEKLVNAYGPLVKNEIAKRLPRLEDIEEVAQDVFQHAAQGISQFQRQRKGSFRCWLRRIAHARTTDLIRKRAQHPHGAQGSGDTHVQQLLQNHPAAEDQGPVDELEEHIAYWRQRVYDEMRKVADGRDFEIWMNVTVEKRSRPEVATRFAIPVAEVYRACHRVNAIAQKITAKWKEIMEL